MKKNLRNVAMEMIMAADEAASLPVVDFTYAEIVAAKGRLSCTSCISAAVNCVKALEANPFNREALANLFVLQCGSCYTNEEFMMPKTADVMNKVRSLNGTEMTYGLRIDEMPDDCDDYIIGFIIDDIRFFDGTVQSIVYDSWSGPEYLEDDPRTEIDGNLWYAWWYYMDTIDYYALYKVVQSDWLTIS